MPIVPQVEICFRCCYVCDFSSSSKSVGVRSVLIFREEGLVAVQNKQYAIYILVSANAEDHDDDDDGGGNGSSDGVFATYLYD